MEETRKNLNKRYNKYVNAVSPTTNVWKSLFHSFWIGGLTCLAAELIFTLYEFLFPSMEQPMVGNITLMTIIAIAIILTALGVYDRMGRFGGAGLFLPITGFANSMSSSAIEFKSEGLIFGSTTKIFNIVGPVLVNGIIFSSVVGIIHLLIFGRTA
ncbi:MAG: SpoVA/SpoVAEb family sporulation membrane protein [Firmicutes bacterium]|nr:SpoVA/SpoVAEb family sporulation membrane protein [Bacillota bacterium]MCL2256201.1 SpoVA/SpoVAEb family sporulation membrane protein [Bacillota bacterium]